MTFDKAGVRYETLFHARGALAAGDSNSSGLLEIWWFQLVFWAIAADTSDS